MKRTDTEKRVVAWTSATEQLPPYNTALLLWYKDGSILAGMRTMSGFVTAHSHYRFPDVTHWMLLPNPPTAHARAKRRRG